MPKEYIEREAADELVGKIKENICEPGKINIYCHRLLGLPAADVVPVVRAHWIREKEFREFQTFPQFKCSNCGKYDPVEYEVVLEESQLNFCPYCGARMSDEVV